MKTVIKSYRFIILIVLMICAGWFVFSQIHYKSKERALIKEVRKKGESLVSLIAMYRIDDLKGSDRNYFLRILSEYIVKEGLAYCVIHDRNEKPIVSFVPGEIESQIPVDVMVKSMFAKGMTEQTYVLKPTGTTIYEYAKPVFVQGQVTGIVRLGMKLPEVELYTLENLSTTALALFLGITLFVFGYYEVLSLLKRLRTSGPDSEIVPEVSGRDDHIGKAIANIENLLTAFDQKRKDVEQENLELKSGLSAVIYEKKQMFTILNSIDFGIMVTDTKDSVLFINNYALLLFGKHVEGMHSAVGCRLDDITDNDEIKRLIVQQNSVEQGLVAEPVVMTFPGQAPGQWFQVSSALLKDEQGIPVGKKIFVTNITREKKSEQSKEDFITHVSHELMTPLTNIKSYSELLMDNEVEDREMQKEFFNTINDETDRLSGLIKNILNLAQMESGTLTMNKGIVKTDWLVESCLQSVEGSAHEKGVTIETDMPDNFPTLVADKEMIKAAVINVLGNALKYSPANSRITFSICESDGLVVLDVVDSGYGISDADIPRIFNKFYRSESENIVEQAGSGLGLAITSEIVTLHGGEIEVVSELGKGSHFSIKLPREEYYIGSH